jgi:hypothetical protein
MQYRQIHAGQKELKSLFLAAPVSGRRSIITIPKNNSGIEEGGNFIADTDNTKELKHSIIILITPRYGQIATFNNNEDTFVYI